MAMLGFGAWWIGLQWMIALIVYGARSGPPSAALINAAFVAAGGASQLVFLSALLPLTDHWFRRSDRPLLDVPGPALPALVRNLSLGTPAGRYALRVATAMTLASGIVMLWGLSNGYWAPMTVAILIRPDPHDTVVRAVSRIGGTLIGAGVTTLLVAQLQPDRTQLGLILLVAVWACYTLQRVNYGVFSACITTYVVLLLSALGLPEPEVALHRVEATLAGAAIALSIRLVSIGVRRGP
jgi:uncharacterized membrane protein YccC